MSAVEGRAEKICGRLIGLAAYLVPLGEREDWRREWQAEIIHHRQHQGDSGAAFDLLRRTSGALVHALWLQAQEWHPDTFRLNVRYALRHLRQRPVFLTVAVLTFALGIGANAAIFSMIDAVLLTPLPYPEADRLVKIWESNPALGFPHDHPSPGNVLDWQRDSTSFEGITAWWVNSRTTLGEPEPEELVDAWVTADFFTVFGVEAVLGRTFLPAEVAAQEAVVVISHGLWQRRFGADPGVVGRKMRFKDVDRLIVGVMPPSFAAPVPEVEIWTPWDFEQTYDRLPSIPRNSRFLDAVGRLRPGVRLAEAEADLGAIAARLAADFPETNAGWSVRLGEFYDVYVGESKRALLVLLGAVALVLLLACANVTSLLLVRAVGRSREVAVRAALGASRAKLLRQLLTEGLVLAALGGVLGIGLAHFSLRLVVALRFGDIPRLENARLDPGVLIFTLAVMLGAGLLAGLIPALKGSSVDITDGLRADGGKSTPNSGRGSLRGALVVVEFALALVLLVGAGLLIRSFDRLLEVDPGFQEDRLLVVRVFLDRSTSAPKRLTYFPALMDRLAELPGVESASATTVLPMSPYGTDFDRPYWRSDRPRPVAGLDETAIRMVLPGYFQTLGIPLQEGRDVIVDDRHGNGAVILVNRTLAERMWPGESPLGKGLTLDYTSEYPYEVIGVVGDSRYYGPRSVPRPEIFIPYLQNPYPELNVVLRTAGAPAAMIPAVRRTLLELDPEQPAHSIVTMNELITSHLARDRFATLLLTVFAALAIVLATVGIYGVMAYAVRQRRREIGVRMALGAASRDVLGLVVRHAFLLAGLGVLLGTAGAALVTPLLGTLLYEVSPLDPWTFGAVAALLLLTGLLAGYLPGRRAARLDPTMSLRQD